jgi:hypothetical protein
MSIIDDNSEIRNVKGITLQQEEDIINFLQGAIYCWCNNNDGWFSMRDFAGRDNFHWQGTPLFCLYKKHEEANSDDPVKAAGKDSGWLLKKAIDQDKREFLTKKEDFIRKYRWNADNSY